jgi:hypothetical protein
MTASPRELRQRRNEFHGSTLFSDDSVLDVYMVLTTSDSSPSFKYSTCRSSSISLSQLLSVDHPQADIGRILSALRTKPPTPRSIKQRSRSKSDRVSGLAITDGQTLGCLVEFDYDANMTIRKSTTRTGRCSKKQQRKNENAYCQKCFHDLVLLSGNK